LYHPPSGSQVTNTWITGVLMCAALACDFADGLVARLLGVSSEIGKQLDSLADMVTFGVVPGLLVYVVLQAQVLPLNLPKELLDESMGGSGAQPAFYRYLPFVAVLIPLFSAYRLAKFNVDTRQTDHFRGLATPTNAFFFLSIHMMYFLTDSVLSGWTIYPPLSAIGPEMVETAWYSFLYEPLVLSLLTVGFSILLVTNIPLIAFKMKDYSLRHNLARYLLLGISVILLLIFQYKAVPMILVLYFLLSFIDRSRKKQ
jgi:CDP-diacylglycerol--serine O-phosphatidyltransferase